MSGIPGMPRYAAGGRVAMPKSATRASLAEAGAVITEEGREVYIDFPNLAAFSQIDYHRRSDTHDSYMRTFYFGRHLPNYESSVEAIRKGAAPDAVFQKYLEMRNLLQPAVDKFAGLGITTKRKRVFRDEGSELDLDRVAVGNPECWESRVKGRKMKRIRLAVQMGYVAGASEEIFIRGAALATAAADVFQRIGYAVEILGVDWGDNGHRNVVTTVVLKSPSEPLDHRNLLCIGLPICGRVFNFGATEAFISMLGVGMPRMTDATKKHLDHQVLINQDFTFDSSSVEYDQVLLEGLFAEMKDVLAAESRQSRQSW